MDAANLSNAQKADAAKRYVLPMSIDGAPPPKLPATPGDVVSRNAGSETPTDATARSSKVEKLPNGGTKQVVDGSTVTSDNFGRVTSIEDAQHQTTSFKYADKTSKDQPDTLLSYTDSKGNTLSRPDGTTNQWTTADGKYFNGTISASKNGTTFSDAQTGAQTTINTDGSRKTVYGDKLEVDQDASGKPTKVVDTNGKVVDAKNISTDGGNISFSRNDGAVVNIAADGSRNTQNADGSSIQTNDAQKVTSLTTASGSNYQFDYNQSGSLTGFKNEQGWWQSGDGGKTWTNSTEDPTTKKVTNTSIAGNVSVDGQGNFTIASDKQPGDVQAASKTIHADGSQTQANTDGSNLTVKPDGSSITQSVNGDISVTNANKQQYQFQFQHDASGNIETDANGNKKLASVTNANGHWEAQPDGKTWTNTDPNATAENKTWSGTMSVNSQGDYSYTPSDTNVKTTLKTDGTSIQQKPDGSQVATDTNGQISRSVDASGHVTTFGHDATTGALNKITTDAGSWSTSDGTNWSNGSTVWSGAISVNNNTGDITYKDSTKTQTARLDGTGSVSNSDGSNVSLNQQGKISSVQDGAHHTFSYGYQKDSTGQQALTSAQTPDGTYTSKDGGKTFSAPDGKPVQVKLDSSGNLTVSESGTNTRYQTDGSKVTSDSSDRVTSTVDASGRQSTFQYAGSSTNITQATINDTVSGKSTTYTSTDGGATLSDGKHTVSNMQVDKQGNLSYNDQAGGLKNNYSDGTSFNIKSDGGSYTTDAKGQLSDAITANGFNVSLKRASDGSITDAYTSLGHFQQTQKDTWTNTDKPSEVVHGSLSATNDGTLSFKRTDANTVTLKGDQTTVERPDHSSFTKDATGETVAASTQSVTASPRNFTYQYSPDAATGKPALSGYSDGSTQWTKSGTDTWTSNTGSSFHGSVVLDKNELPQVTNNDTKTTTTYGVGGGVRELDSSGKLVSKEAPNGNKESFGYDSTGALSSIKSDSSSWSRSASGTWSNGSETFKGSVSVDSHGNQSWVASDNSVRKSIASDGAEKDYYSTQGQVSAVVGKNAAGQVTDTLDGQGRSTQYSYQAGKLAAVSDGQNTWKASTDGKSWSLNGDTNQQFHGTVSVDGHGTQTWTNSDNGSVRKANADGSSETALANGARIQIDATGEKTTYTQASTSGKPTQIQVTPDETRITNPTTRTVLSQKAGSDSLTLSDSTGKVLNEIHGSISVDNNGNATVVNKDAHTSVAYSNDGKATVSKLASEGPDAQRAASTTAVQRGAAATAVQEAQRNATALESGSEAQRGAKTTAGTTGLEAQRGSTPNQEGPLSAPGTNSSTLKPTAETVEKGVAAKTPTVPTAVTTAGKTSGEALTGTGALTPGSERSGSTLASLGAAEASRAGSSAPVHQEAPVTVHQPTLSSAVPTGENLFKASTPENTLSVSNIGGQSALSGGQLVGGGKATGAVTLGSGGPGAKQADTYSSSASTVTSVGSEGGTRTRHLTGASLDIAFGGGRAEVQRTSAEGNADGGYGARRTSEGSGGGYGGGEGGRQESGSQRQESGSQRQESGSQRQESGSQRQDGGSTRQEGGTARQEDGSLRQDGTGRTDGLKGEAGQPGLQKTEAGQIAGQKTDGGQLGGQKGEGGLSAGTSTLARADGKADGTALQGIGKSEAAGGSVVAKIDATPGSVQGKGAGQPEAVAGKSPVLGSSETLLKGSVSVDARVTTLADGKVAVATPLEGGARTTAGSVIAEGKLGSPNPALQTASKDGITTGGATLAAGGKLAAGSDLVTNRLPNGLERYAVGPGSASVSSEKTVALNNPNSLPNGQLAKLGFADGAVLLNGGKAGDLHASSLSALAGGKTLDGKGTTASIDGKTTLAASQLDSKAGGLDSKIVTLQAQQVASLDATKGRVDVQAVANHQAPQVLAKSDVIGATVTKVPDTVVRGTVQDLRGTDVGRAPIKDQGVQPIQETKTVATTTTAAGGTASSSAGATAGAASGGPGAPGHAVAGLASSSTNLAGPGQAASALGAHSPSAGAGVLSNGLPVNVALPGQPGVGTMAGGVVNSGFHTGLPGSPGANVPGQGTALPAGFAGTTAPIGASSLPTAQANGHSGVSSVPTTGAAGHFGATSALPSTHDPNGSAKSVSAQGQPISITGGLSLGPNGAPTLNVNVGVNLGNGLPGANLGVAVNLGGNNGQPNSTIKGLPSGTAPGGTTSLPGGVTGMPTGVGATQGVQAGGHSGSHSGSQSGKAGVGAQPVNGQGGLPANGTININLGSGGTNNGVVNVPGSAGNTNAGVINVNGGSNNLNNGVVNVQGGAGNLNAGTINYNNGSGNVNKGTINNVGGSGVTNVGTINTNGGNGNINNGSINSVGGQGVSTTGNGVTKTGVGSVPGSSVSSTPVGTGTVTPGGPAGQAANGSGQTSTNPIGVGVKPVASVTSGTAQQGIGTTSGASPIGQASPLPVQGNPGQTVSGSSQNPSLTGSGTGSVNTYQPPSQVNNAPGGSTVQSNQGQNSGVSRSGQGPTITGGQNPNGSSGVSVNIPISSGIGVTFGESTGANGKTQGNIGVTIGGVSIGVNTGTGQVSVGDPYGSAGSTGASGKPSGNIGITVGGVTIGVNTGNGQVSVGGTIGGIIGGILGLGSGSGYGQQSGSGTLQSGPPGGYPGTGSGSTATGTGGTGYPTGGTGNSGQGFNGPGTGTGNGTGTGIGNGTGTGYGTGTGNGTGNTGAGNNEGTGNTGNGGTGSTSTGSGTSSGNPTGGSGSSSGGSDSSTYTGTGDGGNGTGTGVSNPGSSGSDPGIPGNIQSGADSTFANPGDSSGSGISGTSGSASGTDADAGLGSDTSSSGTGPLSGTIFYDDNGAASGSTGGSGTGYGSGSSTGGPNSSSSSDGSITSGGNSGSTASANGSTPGIDAGNYSGTSQNSPDGGVAYNAPINGVDGSSAYQGSSAQQSGLNGSLDSSAAGGDSSSAQAGMTTGSDSGSTQSGQSANIGSNAGSAPNGTASSDSGSTQSSMAGSDSGSTQLGLGGSDFAPANFGSDFSPTQLGFAGSDIASNQFETSGSDSNSQATASDTGSSQSGRSASNSDSTSASGQMGSASPDFTSFNEGAGYASADGFIPSFNDNGGPSANTNNALSDSASGDFTQGASSNAGANAGTNGLQSDLAGQLGGGFDSGFGGNISQNFDNGDLTSFAPNGMGNDGSLGSGSPSPDFGAGHLSSFDQQQYGDSPIANRRNGNVEGTPGGDLISFTGPSSSDDGFMPGSFSTDFSSPHAHGERANANSGNAYDGDYANAGPGLDDGNRTARSNDRSPDSANFNGGWGNTGTGFSGDLGNLISFEDGRPVQNDVPLDGSASGGNPFGNDDLAGRFDGVYDYRHQDHHSGYDDGISYGDSDNPHHKHHDHPWTGDLSDSGMTAPDGRQYGVWGDEDNTHKDRAELGTGWLGSDSDNAANRVDSSGLVAQTANEDTLLDAAMKQMRLEDDEARMRQDRLDLQARLDQDRQLKQSQDALMAEQALQAALKLQQEQQSKDDEAARLLALIASAQEEEKREDNKQELYRVKTGDTLERIALKKFQDPSIAPLIFELNKSKIEMQISGTKVAYRLKEGSLLTLPSRRQVREFKQRQLTAAAQGMDVFGQPLTSSAKRLLDESQQRRANVEKILGQIDATPTDGRVKVNVRLGDTLRSVAMKHPGVNDVSLWKLLAEVNGLSTDVDSKGTPIAQLRRGTPLIIPSAEDINAYKNRGTASGAHRSIAQIAAPIVGRADMTVITGNRNPQSLNIKAENLDPVEQKWVQETLINSLIEKLGEACRVVKSSDGGENRMIRSQLEVLTGDVWVPIITYEICDTASVRYEIAPDGSRVSIPIDLPSSTVEELMSNDLQKNWRSYAKQFLKNRTEAS
jgi:YD repeat-containing protein